MNLMPCILISSLPCMLFLRWYYKEELGGEKKVFDIESLKKKYPITDKVLLAKSGIILTTVLLLFFLHPVHHVDTSWVACVGAVALMIVASPHEVSEASKASDRRERSCVHQAERSGKPSAAVGGSPPLHNQCNPHLIIHY